MQEPRKSTLLFVQDAAAEPAALGAFAAEQPALALVTADGLDEAERKLAQLDPALVVWQCDAPGLPALLNQQWMPLAGAVTAYLAAGILGAALIAWYTVLTARISQAILFDLRKRVFLHTQRLSLEFHESYTSGRIIARQTSEGMQVQFREIDQVATASNEMSATAHDVANSASNAASAVSALPCKIR